MFGFNYIMTRMQTIKGEDFTVLVVKSDRRKTTALKIKNGEVSIHIPTRLPIELAQHFVKQKTPWIRQKLQDNVRKSLPQPQFINGESVLYLGQDYQLQVILTERKTTTKKNKQTIEVHGRPNHLSPTAIRAALITWYKQQAELYLKSQTKTLSIKTNLFPQSITVKTYKARWGSCRVNGDIQYNWKLILAPPDIIDYVIIHELCHLEQHNHSERFWQLVNTHYPNFKMARLWLKKNGDTLDI